jgi:hypothetical protein
MVGDGHPHGLTLAFVVIKISVGQSEGGGDLVLLTSVLILWAAVTVAFVAVMIWKSFAGINEEDTLLLSEGEAKEAAEQQEIIARVERLASWAKVLGIASLVLLLLAGGVWIYPGIVGFTKPQVP